MVMNKQKQLFGVVAEQEENNDYVGLKTATATVTVDNTDRTISVDVHAEGLLGDSASKAYPGNLGYQDRRLIIDTIQDLDEHKGEFEKYKDASENTIEDLTIHVDVVEHELNTSIKTESTRAQKEEASIRQNLADSVHELTADIQTVDSKVDNAQETIKQNYTQLVTLVEDTKTQLSNDIADTQHKIETELAPVVEQLQARDTELFNSIQLVSEELTNVDNKLAEHVDFSAQTYADKSYVESQFQEYTKTVDLPTKLSQFDNDVNYAKITDIPDVSSFIAEIPAEYVTENELTDILQETITKFKFIDGGSSATIS